MKTAASSLEAVTRLCLDQTLHPQRFLDPRGRCHVWREGRRAPDGALTGPVFRVEPDGRLVRVGSFRIEADGWIRRFPGLGALRVLHHNFRATWASGEG